MHIEPACTSFLGGFLGHFLRIFAACNASEYGVLGLLGGFRVGNRGLGRAENNGVSTNVTKGKQGKTAERESGLASL